ncbi:MAG: hypothetical protein IJS22_01220 [Lachnospiraceae bacterium]|nr:hypothetical protein [Lachnospiraceae bacterium]
MNEGGMTVIDSAEALELLRTDPSGHFILTSDINLKNAFWEPVSFDGILNGNGKTISGIRIAVSTPDGNQGFFGSLSEKASVSDLSLRTINVTADKNAKYIGAIAGTNLGRIERCTVGADAPFEPVTSGKRNTITDWCDNSNIYLYGASAVCGAIAGKNLGTVTDVRSYLTLHARTQGLCGENNGEADGLYRDASNRSELLPSRAVQMRRDIVSRMETMGDFRWIPSKDMCFTSAYSGTRKIYEKDAVHYGLPYTQKYGSPERAQYCLDENGYVRSWLPEFSDAAPEAAGSTEVPWDVFLGNDCSGAVYWSWMRACPSVSFGFTGDMIPTAENQEEYGVLPIGNYTSDTLNTKEIIEKNGREMIAECFSGLRMGDAIVQRDPEHGHTRLAAGDAFIMRDESGKIDTDASYIVTHEQGVGKGSSGRNSTWQLFARYTLNELLEDYIPITNRDLINGEPAEVRIDTDDVTGPFDGTIKSNYRIISSTVRLKNIETGKNYINTLFTAVDENRCKERPDDGFARSTVREIALSTHRDGFADIPCGTYRYEVLVTLSTGYSHRVCGGIYEIK